MSSLRNEVFIVKSQERLGVFVKNNNGISKIVDPKPIMCEWNIKESRLSLNKEAHAVASVIVGDNQYKLCRRCSKIAKFRRMPIVGYFHPPK